MVVLLHRRTWEREPKGQVRGAVDLGHPPSTEAGDSRPEDAAWHSRQVVQIDHAGPGHPVFFCKRDFGVEASGSSGDVGNSDSVAPAAVGTQESTRTG